MSNSNYDNSPGQETFRGRNNYEKSNFRDRSAGRRDGGGFRIRLSDNEMKAVKSIQEKFELRSTVAVLGFSVRILSEMIRDEKLIESISKYAESNKNSNQIRKSQATAESEKKTTPDPFARPVKSTTIKEIESNKEEEEEDAN